MPDAEESHPFPRARIGYERPYQEPDSKVGIDDHSRHSPRIAVIIVGQALRR
jgi:hypothetical protein